MGYTDSFEICSGQECRWHRDRLLKSPFIYKLNKNGKKYLIKTGVVAQPFSRGRPYFGI